MKRVKNRQKHFRITNPLGFSLFCAMIILIVGLIVGTVIFFTSGGFDSMMKCINNKVKNEPAATDAPRANEPGQEAETTPDDGKDPGTDPKADPTAEGTADPDATPLETPETGTPVPETPTPPPIQPETPRPDETPEPDPKGDAPLAGFTIGIDPVRDGGSKYKEEGKYNLAFAQQLKEYLESKGAKVVITREDNKKEVGNSKRAKIIKNAKCDVAIRIMCNEVGSSTHGCFVQGTKKNEDFCRAILKAYSEGTGMKIQSSKGKGFDKVSDEVASKCGCPCARLILGNWKNKSDRANLEDDAFREKMVKAIYEGLLGQLRK